MTTKDKDTNAAPSTDIEPAKAGVLAPVDDPWGEYDDGLVGTEAARLSMPRIVSDMRPGQGYTNEVTGEKSDHLRFIWLARKWTRAAHLQDDGNGGVTKRPFGTGDPFPDCFSADMERPDPSSPAVQADACAVCPHSQFGPDNEAPACRERLHVFGFDLDNEHYFRTSFSGTALGHVNGYISALKARRPAKPTFAQVTEVKLTEVKGTTNRTQGRIWLEPEILPGEALNPAEVAPLLATRDQFITQWETHVAEDAVAGDEAAAAEASNASSGRATSSEPVQYAEDEEPF